MLYAKLVTAGAEPKAAANVLMNQFAAAGIDPERGQSGRAREADREALEYSNCRFQRRSWLRAERPSFAADRLHLAESAISSTAELEPLIDRILADNPAQVEQYRGGKEGLLGFFVGQVMKETGGKANAKVVSELVRAKLSAN